MTSQFEFDNDLTATIDRIGETMGTSRSQVIYDSIGDTAATIDSTTKASNGKSIGGVPVELTDRDRAVLRLAYWVIGGVGILFVLCWLSLFFTTPENKAYVQQFFDFVKLTGVPIVTLVLGFYFRGELKT